MSAVPSGVSLELDTLSYQELVKIKSQLQLPQLLAYLADGRATVRANALLGLAALGHAGTEYIMHLRDSDLMVARAAAEALIAVYTTQVPNVVAISDRLDGAHPEIAIMIAGMFAQMIGIADAELISALDTTKVQPVTAILAACELGADRGLAVLAQAARDGRTRVRINAMRGLAFVGEHDHLRAMATLQEVERDDTVSDVRAAARVAIGMLTVRVRSAAAERRRAQGKLPSAVPELDAPDLSPGDASKLAARAPLEELMHALPDERSHVRINAVRMIGAKGGGGPSMARSLGVLLRDPDASVRAVTAASLDKLGNEASAAGPDLVRALGDRDAAVVAAATAALERLGVAALGALVDGLDTPGEAHGARVAALVAKLPDGPALLREALASTSVDARIHAATALGALGAAGGAVTLAALGNVAIGGNARLRAAVTRAIAAVAPRPLDTPPPIAIDGFADRALTDAQLEKAKAALTSVGAGGVAAHLRDVQPHVRANAALALGVLGGPAYALVAALNDEVASVRLAAVQGLTRLGDSVIVESAPALLRLLVDPDPQVSAAVTELLGRPGLDSALARALDEPTLVERVLEGIIARTNALEILGDAWRRPGAQAGAARGFVLLGKERLGAGRMLLEAGRTSSSPLTRDLSHAALRAIDGDPTAPAAPPIAGFEAQLVEASAVPAKLAPATVAPFLADGRPVVRANAALALGVCGGTAYAPTLAALLKDEDLRVRTAAARALDKLGDDIVLDSARALVTALADAALAEVVKPILVARKGKVASALVGGLDVPDEAHGMRIAEVICELPDARDLLFAAFDGPAQNVTINAGFGIGLLGAKRAGDAGRARLRREMAGPITRKHHAMRKALTLFER